MEVERDSKNNEDNILQAYLRQDKIEKKLGLNITAVKNDTITRLRQKLVSSCATVMAVPMFNEFSKQKKELPTNVNSSLRQLLKPGTKDISVVEVVILTKVLSINRISKFGADSKPQEVTDNCCNFAITFAEAMIDKKDTNFYQSYLPKAPISDNPFEPNDSHWTLEKVIDSDRVSIVGHASPKDIRIDDVCLLFITPCYSEKGWSFPVKSLHYVDPLDVFSIKGTVANWLLGDRGTYFSQLPDTNVIPKLKDDIREVILDFKNTEIFSLKDLFIKCHLMGMRGEPVLKDIISLLQEMIQDKRVNKTAEVTDRNALFSVASHYRNKL